MEGGGGGGGVGDRQQYADPEHSKGGRRKVFGEG